MQPFTYRSGRLYAEAVSVQRLATEYGTPLYIYSRNYFRAQYRALAHALREMKPLICYSMKANSNGSVVRTFLDEGAGLDIVSGGELFRALRAGADPSKIVFAGVGKTREEIEYALRKGILFFTVESEPEARRIGECARRLRRRGRIAFRVNPDVDARTHKYTTTGRKQNKFGLDIRRVEAACRSAAQMPGIEVVGLHMHIGSQILSPEPFVRALRTIGKLCASFRSRYPTFRYLDIGGGLGIQYRPQEKPLDAGRFAAAVTPLLKAIGLSIVIEPGRTLVGNGAILAARVQYVKNTGAKTFIIADGGMNDLIRPSLYGAYHEILPTVRTTEVVHGDLVGPVCESGDFMALDRDLPALRQGDLLAVRSVGAYGFSMASNYNSRPRPAEVMVDGRRATLIRRRESWADLVRGERMAPGGKDV
jgi:diaminopimelate decarboxylase